MFGRNEYRYVSGGKFGFFDLSCCGHSRLSNLSCINFYQTVDIAAASITFQSKCSVSLLAFIKPGFKLFRSGLRLHLNPLQCIHCKIARLSPVFKHQQH